MWVELSTITLIDSDEDVGAGFAPNRHFSIIDNFALAEIPSGPVDRSKLAVFNLSTEQPTGEESADEGSNNSDDGNDSVVAPIDNASNTSNTGIADPNATNTVTSDSGGGAMAPLALLLIIFNIFAFRCTRRLSC